MTTHGTKANVVSRVLSQPHGEIWGQDRPSELPQVEAMEPGLYAPTLRHLQRPVTGNELPPQGGGMGLSSSLQLRVMPGKEPSWSHQQTTSAPTGGMNALVPKGDEATPQSTHHIHSTSN